MSHRFMFLTPGSNELNLLDTGESPPTLEELQRLVGGYIEQCYRVPGDAAGALCVLVNEEGRLQNLMPLCYAPQIPTVLLGPAIIHAVDDDGEVRDMTDSEIGRIVLQTEPIPILTIQDAATS